MKPDERAQQNLEDLFPAACHLEMMNI